MPRYNGGAGGTSRKYHRARRGFTTTSNYPERLRARGLTSKSVRMRSLEDLRKRAERAERGEQEDEES
jgi:hypothetical protein